MGKFDGILIASDWDGTLFNGKEIPENNIEAIKYFQENGGLFTICSGRAPEYVNDMTSLCRPNTYVACLNGAVIYDPVSKRILCEGFVGDEAYRILDELLGCGTAITRVTFAVRENGQLITLSPEEYAVRKEDMMAREVYKITVRTTDAAGGERLTELAKTLLPKEHGVMRSYYLLVEILNNGFTKGRAARYIKEAAGAHTLIGVGDYENDISLLECADIGYAVDNALDSVKAVADRLTVSVNEGAIAAIVAELDKTI